MSEHEDVKIPDDERTYLFDNPKNIQRLLRGFYVVCVVLVLLEFVIHRHVTHPIDRVPAAYAIFGFVAFWGLVVSATKLRRFLMRDEDYYDGA